MALEIIGAGFGRTGTNSLKIALEHLGFGPCHHMFEVRDNPERLPDWQAAADGRTVDWHHVFRDYRSQVDWPGARYWRELLDAFPDAKVPHMLQRRRERFRSQIVVESTPRLAVDALLEQLDRLVPVFPLERQLAEGEVTLECRGRFDVLRLQR